MRPALAQWSLGARVHADLSTFVIAQSMRAFDGEPKAFGARRSLQSILSGPDRCIVPPHPPQREPGLHEALIPGGTMVRPTGRPGRVWAGPVASTARALPRRIALQPPRCSPWRGVPCPSVPDRSARRQGVNRCAPFIACATLWALRSARRPLLLLRGASPAHPGAATALS